MSDDGIIRRVEPAQAEALLTIRLFIPGVFEGGGDRYYLARTPPRREGVTESVTVNPDGSVTTRRTVRVQSTDVVDCTYGDGRTADGRGYGFGKQVSVEGRSADAAVVHLSMYWTDRTGGQGQLGEDVVVPWLGRTRKELRGGGWVEGEITPVGGAAEPGAAPDRRV